MPYWSPGRQGPLCFFYLEGQGSYPKKAIYLWSKDGTCCLIFPLPPGFISPFFQNLLHSITNCWDLQAAHGKLSAVLIPTVCESIHLLSSLKSYKFCIAVSWGGEEESFFPVYHWENSYFSSYGAGEAGMTPLFTLEGGAVTKRRDSILRVWLRYPYKVSAHLSVFCLSVCLHPFPLHAPKFSCHHHQKRAWNSYLPCMMHVLDRNLLPSLIHSTEPDYTCWIQRLTLKQNEYVTQEQYQEREHKGVSSENQTWLPWASKCQPRRKGLRFRQLTHRTCVSIAREKHLTSLSLAYPKAICELDLYYSHLFWTLYHEVLGNFTGIKSTGLYKIMS